MTIFTDIIFYEMNNSVEGKAIHGTAIRGLMCAKNKIEGYNIDDEISYYPASFEEDNIITVASMRSGGKIDCTYNYGITSVDLIA